MHSGRRAQAIPKDSPSIMVALKMRPLRAAVIATSSSARSCGGWAHASTRLQPGLAVGIAGGDPARAIPRMDLLQDTDHAGWQT